MRHGEKLKNGEPVTRQVILNNVDVCADSGCWIWKRSFMSNGYPAIWSEGKVTSGQRVVYGLWFGRIDPDLFACHKCDNKKCLNPDHLFAGTHADNMRDCVNKGRHKHAVFSGVNHPRARLSRDQVIAIRNSNEISKWAKMFGVSKATIKNAKSRYTYATVD